jgi:hypothetical protein
VGVTVASDGSLLVTDDGSNSIWRVVYTGATGTRKDATEQKHANLSAQSGAN